MILQNPLGLVDSLENCFQALFLRILKCVPAAPLIRLPETFIMNSVEKGSRRNHQNI